VAQALTCAAKLAEWQKARPGRLVGPPQRVNVNAVAWECECTEGGVRVVCGVGRTAEAATKDACDKLWAKALEEAGPPSNPTPRWSK